MRVWIYEFLNPSYYHMSGHSKWSTIKKKRAPRTKNGVRCFLSFLKTLLSPPAVVATKDKHRSGERD